MIKGKSIPVKATNVLTGEVIVFGSAKQAEELGFIPTKIASVCKGKAKTHKGYKWEYLLEVL